MLISGGRVVLADSNRGSSTTSTIYTPSDGIALSRHRYATYGQLYRSSLWVFVACQKRASAVSRLPLKFYRRAEAGRIELRDHPCAQLIRRPNARMSGAALLAWVVSTYDIYGEAFLFKIRGRDGRPAELIPVHPSNVAVRQEGDTVDYLYGPGAFFGSDPQLVAPERDVIHFKRYSPDSTLRGMSPLEPLRQTLANEDSARRASSAFWANGGRPSGFMTTPQRLSPEAIARLRSQWESTYAGADNYGRLPILEEGLRVEQLNLSAEEAQYIESRKLNREEVAAAYDVPLPAIGIHDHSTYGNVRELLRSMYRDALAPLLAHCEAELDRCLVAEWGDENLYVEFLLDDVLRGDWEQRVASYSQLHAMGWTLNELRELENRPHLPGGDTSMVNAALIPLTAAVDRTRELNPAAAPLLPAADTRSLDSAMGMLGRVKSVDSIDIERLCERLNGHGPTVRALHAAAVDAGMPIDDFRGAVRHVLTGA